MLANAVTAKSTGSWQLLAKVHWNEWWQYKHCMLLLHLLSFSSCRLTLFDASRLHNYMRCSVNTVNT